ncbi:AhpA/YtjB family protein [Endozoicomonas euniceicola]|uniref:AhpA/YtjB family protein n=1 Tax=Endozoicomonas euniceicola TaxID=1234143 RepID=A0ABY6H2H6_9GAMM|nr:AhpA/YtjB family protein [Endozoicomonas euniceicola]UYM18446.1 AhpA/YtjB family protein [Endozoicomonas euniceicola]
MQSPINFIKHITDRLYSLSIRNQLLLIFSLFFIAVVGSSGMIIRSEMNTASQHQSDTIGALLSQQTASAATDMLVTGDRLSLSVLLNQLVQTPYVARAAIYSIDNRKIASSESEESTTTSGQTYSSPIHYQDVIAGYVRLQLDEALLTKNARDALVVISAVSLILLVAALIFLHTYATTLSSRLELVLRQLRSLLQTPLINRGKSGNELTLLAHFVEQQLTEKLASSKPEDEEPEVEQDETSVVVCVRSKNLTRLRQLISHQDMMDILHTHTFAIEQAASLYNGEISYTPEGNAYIRFSSLESSGFVQDALSCSLLVESVSRVIGENAIVKIQVGIGLCVSDEIPDFPGDESPSEVDSAAGNALMLASLPGEDSLNMLKEQLNWLPAELAKFSASEHAEDIVQITGIAEEQQKQINQQAYNLSRELERE